MHVQVIRSKSSIRSMLETLNKISSDLGEPNEFTIRPICSFSRHSGVRETNQNLLFSRLPLTQTFVDTYNGYFAKDNSSFIEEYNWDKFKSWDLKKETNHLHFKGFPRTMMQEEVVEIIEKEISFLLGPESYTLDVPIAWKINSTVKGFGTIKFSEAVSDHDRKLCKLLLHNMSVMQEGNSSPSIISFHWMQTNPSRRRTGRMIHRSFSPVMEMSSADHI